MTVIFQSAASDITYYDILGATYCTLMRLLCFFEARLLLAAGLWLTDHLSLLRHHELCRGADVLVCGLLPRRDPCRKPQGLADAQDWAWCGVVAAMWQAEAAWLALECRRYASGGP